MQNQALVNLRFINVSDRIDMKLKTFHSIMCETVNNSKSYAKVHANRAATF